MKKAFKVKVKFEGTCEFWFDASKVQTEEEAKREAMRRIYDGKIGQYFNPIDVVVRDVEEPQVRDEYYLDD